MPFPPSFAWRLARRLLSEEELECANQVNIADAGHGYDPFGLHRAFVALGLGIALPAYKRYFRVKSYGADKVPKKGAAVIACNHSGTVPVDGMMLWVDVVMNSGRVPRPIADHFVPTLPWIGTLFARTGMVGGSRGNARSLLDAGEVLMIFPEGVPGIGKTFAERYQLQKWRVGHCELAIRHRAPVVPVGIVGAEEQMPQIGRINVAAFGAPYIPVPATPIPLPVRYHVHYGDPIPVHRDYTPEMADDPEVVLEAAARVKSAVQGLLDRGLEMREGIFK
jgi:1-acyl-sn-glycerol-3-phosphate acyltransferase